MIRFSTLFLILHILTSELAVAQEEPPATEKRVAPENPDVASKDLARASANPIANLISLPVQLNINYGVGQYDRVETILNLQPVLPFRFGSKVNVINRMIIPIIQKPDDAETGSTVGLGNMNYSMFFVPNSKGIFTWGIGPAFNIPTSSNLKLGGDEFGIGYGIIALVMPGDHWVIGLTFNEIWSYKYTSFHSFFAQYFITYNIKNGWYINTTPTITGNFRSPEGEGNKKEL